MVKVESEEERLQVQILVPTVAECQAKSGLAEVDLKANLDGEHI